MAYLELPNGKYIKVPEGKTPQEAYEAALAKFPNLLDEPAPAKQKRGLGAALGKGTESFLGSIGTAGKALFGDENLAAQEALAQQEALNKKYAEQVSLDKLKDVYEKQGLIAAGKELAGQVPLAIAEQAPNIAATLAGAKLGAMGGSALGPVGTVVGGVAGAVAPSLLSMAGSNIERQAAEQQARGEPLNIGTGRAFATAVPQAGLDVAATFIPLGGKIAGKVFGPQVERLLMRGNAEAAEKLAKESLLPSLKRMEFGTLTKGLAVGAAAEIPTEIAQQMLERAQAGLDLTSPDALKEYGETAYQVGLLAPIGAAGRAVDRSAARTQVEEKQKQEKRAIAEQQRLAKEAEETAAKAAEEQAKLIADEQALAEEQRATGQLFGDKVKAGKPNLSQLTVAEKEVARAQLEQRIPQSSTAITEIEDALDVAIKSGDTDQYKRLSEQREVLLAQIEQDKKQLKALGGVPEDIIEPREKLEKDLQTLQRNFAKYDIESGAYDKKKLDKIVSDIDNVKRKLAFYDRAPTQQDMLFEDTAAGTRYPEYERRMAPIEEQQQAQAREVLDAEAMQEEIERSRGIAEEYLRMPTVDELRAQLKALKEERDALLKGGQPWYMRGRLEEVKALIADIEPKTREAIARSISGTPVTPVKRLKQVQQERLDELLTQLDILQDEPKNTPALNLARKAEQDYIMSALEQIDAERKAQNLGKLSDQQVLGLVQEMRSAFAPVIQNKSSGMLLYPQEGRRVTGLSPLEAQLEEIKAKYAPGEAEFELETQYGFPTREKLTVDQELARLRNQRKTATGAVAEGIDKDIKRLEAKKIDISNVGVVEQEELFSEKTQKAVKKQNVAELEKEIADLEDKFKAANKGKTLKQAVEIRKQLEARKKELADLKEAKPQKGLSVATVRATPEGFMKFLNSKEVNALRAKLKTLTTRAEKLSTKTPEIDKDFLQKVIEQRDYVRDLQGAKVTINQLRAKAQRLWEQTTEEKVLDLKYAIKLWEKDAKDPAATENTIKKATEKIEQIKQEIEDVLKPDYRKRVLQQIDELNARADELAAANFNFERAVLKSMERKLEKMPKASAAAKKLEKDMRTVREQQAEHEATQLKALEERAKEKRLAEQRALEFAEQQRKIVSRQSVDTNLEAKVERFFNLNKEIREQTKTLAGLKEGTKAYVEAARELAKLKAAKASSIVSVKRKPEKIAKEVIPLTAEQKREALLAREKELIEERKAFREQTKQGLTPQELEDEIKAFRKLAEESAKKGNQAAAKRQEAAAKRLEKELKSKMAVARMAMRGEGKGAKPTPPKMKTGVKPETRGRKAKKDFDQDALDHGVAYDDYMEVQRGLAFGFKARDEAAKTGAGITQEEANKALAKVKLPKGLKVVVVNRLQGDLRAAVEAQGMNPDTVRGGVMPNGVVFMIAENHTDLKDFAKTVAHEVTGHLGVEGLLGEAGMNALIKKVTSQYGSVWKLAEDLGVTDDVKAAYMSAKRMGKTEDQALGLAVREMIAHTEEARIDRNTLGKIGEFIKAMVGAVRAALRKIGINLDISTSDVYKLLRDARKDFNEAAPGAYVNKDGEIMFRDKPAVANPGFEFVLDQSDNIVFKQKPLRDRIFGANAGLTFETKYVDRFAPVQRLLDTKMQDSLKASQLMYFLRMHDQRMAFTSEVASNGALKLVEKTRDDGRKEFVIESQEGASLAKIAEILRDADVGNSEATNRIFTVYLAALRAKSVGLEKLNFGGNVTQQMLDNTLQAVEANPATKKAFEEAARVYNDYNRGLIEFAVQTGAISKKTAEALLKDKNYVPYYRPEANGDVFLDIGGAPAIKIGNLKDQPYLHELVGGDQPILDFFTSALQNTSMLTDMALRNLATRNVAFALADMGMLKTSDNPKDIGIRNGTGPADPNVIRFNVEPDPKYDKKDKKGNVVQKDTGERYAIIETEAAGIPTDLLVKGLQGVNTSLPTAVKMMNMPANLLRKWVTRNPAYALRQVVRDPMNAVMVSGADTIPVASSFKEIYKMVKGKSEGEPLLQRRGILGGQVITGTAEDQKKILNDITSGKKGWDYRMAQLDQLAIQGDAATRVVMYNSFIKQGLSEMEATLATLEAMNFSKRGTSASLFMLSTMVPFMNAQIQGLNVLYKAFSGKMPFNEKLKVKKKLIQRGLMMAGFTMLYAAAMQDDEAYQNANDDEKYGNWFVYTPFSDEPVKVPIPFELGFIFKAVPEAIVNTMFGDDKARDVGKALGKMMYNSIPISMPQGIKPGIEAFADYSFYTGRAIESERLKQYDPGERYTERTSELAKLVGGILNISPVKIEYVIRGYTGSLPLAVASVANPVLRSGETGEQPETRGLLSSETPLIGTFFQAKDATGLINKAYRDMEEMVKAKQTYKKMISEGREAEADAYLDANADMISMGSFAGRFRKKMGDLTASERSIRSDSSLSAQEKREALDEIRQLKINLAKELSSARD